MPLTSVLDIWSLRASSSIGIVMSPYSRSQETGTFISTSRLAASEQLRNALYAAADPPASGRFPTGRYAPRGPCPWGPSELPARDSRSSKLLQEPHVVLIEEPDVGRARAEHAEPFDPAAEREALVARGVVPDAAEDVGVDHAATRGLDPAIAAAHLALGIPAFTGEAVERDLG